MEYDVVVGGVLSDFIKNVNKHIECGWIPQGGFCCFNDKTTGGVYYMQAITRVVN